MKGKKAAVITMFFLALIPSALTAQAAAQTAAQTAPTPPAASADSAAADLEAALFGGGGSGAGSADITAAAATANTAIPAVTGSFDAASAGTDIAKTEYLVGGTVAVQAASTIESGAKSYIAASDEAGKLFAKVSVPDYGALYIAYTISHSFFQGYSGDGTAPPARDPYTPAYSLAELHFSFDVAKTVFIRIGNQLISWGPSRIWTPVDFINLKKADSFASLDSRAGKSGVRLHLPLKNSNAFAFADFSNMTVNRTYGDPLKTVNLGGRFDFTVSPFEFGFTGYVGQHSQTHLGLDFSGRLFGATVYGEAALSPSSSSSSQYIQSSLGFSRTLDELKLWTLSAEGFYNSKGKNLEGYSALSINMLPSGKTTPLYQGSWYAYASLAASKLFSPSLSSTLSLISNLEDRSYSVKFAEAFAFPRAVPCTLAASYSGGGRNREFTRYAGDGSVSITLSTRIEF